MVIIAGASNLDLAKSIALHLNCELIIANTKIFSDRELMLQISKDLSGKIVIIIQSIASQVNDNLMELLLIAGYAKECLAKKIIAITPYFAYSRQDVPSYNKFIPAKLISQMLKASAIEIVITVDAHSEKFIESFDLPVKNLSSAEVFFSVIDNCKNHVIISPDAGGVNRAKKLADLCGVKFFHLHKTRMSDGSCLFDSQINFENMNCILIDDIIDTGKTLCQSALYLRKNKAKTVKSFVTHGVFSENSLNRISAIIFDEFYITNSILTPDLPNFIKTLSLTRMICQNLKEIL